MGFFLRRLFAAVLVAVALSLPAAAAEEARVSVKELEDLARMIEDEGQRQQLVSRIRALIAAAKGAKPPVQSPGARIISGLSEKAREAGRQAIAATETLSQLPQMGAWIKSQANDPEARALWLSLVIKITVIIALGVAAGRLSAYFLGRPRRSLESRDVATVSARALFLSARTVLDLAPVVAFAAAAYVAVSVIQLRPQAHLVALSVINAYLISSGLLVLARMILVPAAPSLRLLAIGGETANYLYIWFRRLTSIGVYGYFLIEAALLLGLPAGGHAGLSRILALLLTVIAVVFIFQNRVPVAGWIAGEAQGGSLRERLADIWHVLAALYVAGIFVVWALGVEGGFEYMARATIATLLILAVARLGLAGMGQAVLRGFSVGADLKARFPSLEARANRYVPTLHRVGQALIAVLAGLALFQAWGVDAFGWLATPFGERLLGGAFSIAAVLAVSLGAWEVVSSGIERYLEKTDSEGTIVERGERAKTLLPLLRKVAMVVLSVLVILVVLSELGVEIGPLLAGAGVLGLAFGFGAQTLVKDVITGLFIIVEGTISVGDWVEVGGHEGTVESLSIRTIRLRDSAANVHTVPFSDVGTVLNYTKDFSYAVLNIGVAYRENVDDVMAVIAGIGAEMEEDKELGPDILEPINVQGLNSLDDSAVVIRARIKTKPGMQWSMRRAFNRRMKNRFDELGIEIPFPQTTVHFAPGGDGPPPPGTGKGGD
jgi:small-conductance mechanosensitive channel